MTRSKFKKARTNRNALSATSSATLLSDAALAAQARADAAKEGKLDIFLAAREVDAWCRRHGRRRTDRIRGVRPDKLVPQVGAVFFHRGQDSARRVHSTRRATDASAGNDLGDTVVMRPSMAAPAASSAIRKALATASEARGVRRGAFPAAFPACPGLGGVVGCGT